jgi:rod shape-determining protein MreC
MKRILKYIVSLCLCFSMIFVLLVKLKYKPISTIERIASCIVYPLLKAQSYISRPLKDFVESWLEYKNNVNCHLSYKKEIEDLRAEVIRLQENANYQQDIYEVKVFNERYKQKGILVQVILKSFDENKHFFLIDAGAQKGVACDNVALYKNCLVGRVTEVYPYYSKVTLITDRTIKVAAYCATSRVYGIHEGENSLARSKLSFVNHLEKLVNNDIVISSGEGLIFPRGFALGRIETYAVEGFHYAVTIKPLPDFKNIAYCYVIQKGAQETTTA